ncbi:LapA family protein [Cognatiyoonia sp.]
MQNAALVDYRCLTWQVQVRRSAVVAICTMIGFTVGWLMGASRRRRA